MTLTEARLTRTLNCAGHLAPGFPTVQRVPFAQRTCTEAGDLPLTTDTTYTAAALGSPAGQRVAAEALAAIDRVLYIDGVWTAVMEDAVQNGIESDQLNDVAAIGDSLTAALLGLK